MLNQVSTHLQKLCIVEDYVDSCLWHESFVQKCFYGHPHLWLPMVLTCKYLYVTLYKTLDSIYNMWTQTLQICLFRENDIQRDIANIKHIRYIAINRSIWSTYDVSFYTMHWLPTVPILVEKSPWNFAQISTVTHVSQSPVENFRIHWFMIYLLTNDISVWNVFRADWLCCYGPLF